MIQQKLLDKFGDKINHMSCVYIGDGENTIRHFLKGKKFKTIIEVGTYQGVSTAILSEHAEKVYAIDIEDLPLRKDIFKFLNVNNVEFYKCKVDFEDKKKHIEKIMKEEQVDFIFLDGDHWGEALKQEFDLVKDIPEILIHDYEESFPIVYDFCNDLPNKGYDIETKNLFCLAKKKKKKAVKSGRKSKNNSLG
ncbi:MAG: class I SAM-dependent methyltransferase [Planctomycetota bacterium]|jgi:hypothetical protein